MNKEYIKIEYSNEYHVNEENLEALGVYFSVNPEELIIMLFETLIPDYTEETIDKYDAFKIYDLLDSHYTEVEIIELIAPAIGYEFNTLNGYNERVHVLYPNDVDIKLIKDLIFNENIYDIMFYNENMEVVDSCWEHYPDLNEEDIIDVFNTYRVNAEIGGVIANDITDYIEFDKLKLVEPIPIKYEFNEL